MTSMENLTDSSTNCTNRIPSSEELFENIDSGHLILVIICMILTVISIGIYIEEIVYIVREHVDAPKERIRPLWVLGLYPVISTTSLISICIPRALVANQLVAALYLSTCIVHFLKLIISYFGGRDAMIAVMSAQKMNLRSPPCCCCCCCLPEITVTKTNIVRMNYMVLQVVIIRPLLFYCQAIYLADYGDRYASQTEMTTTLSSLHMVSTLTAMYGLVLVYRASQEHLQKFNIKRKFSTLQLVLLFCNLQGGIFSLAAAAGAFPCTPGGFSSKARAMNAQNTMLIFEMFVLSLMARYFYRRKEPLANFRSYIRNSIMNEDILQQESDKQNYGTIGMSDAVLNGLEDSGVFTVMPDRIYKTDGTDGKASRPQLSRAISGESYDGRLQLVPTGSRPELYRALSSESNDSRLHLVPPTSRPELYRAISCESYNSRLRLVPPGSRPELLRAISSESYNSRLPPGSPPELSRAISSDSCDSQRSLLPTVSRGRTNSLTVTIPKVLLNQYEPLKNEELAVHDKEIYI